jgi:hypothetical protein
MVFNGPFELPTCHVKSIVVSEYVQDSSSNRLLTFPMQEQESSDTTAAAAKGWACLGADVKQQKQQCGSRGAVEAIAEQ